MIERYVKAKQFIQLHSEICRLERDVEVLRKNKNMLLSLCLEGIGKSKKLGDYYSYFYFMEHLLYICNCFYPAKTPKYAQHFFQEMDHHLEETMLAYPDKNLSVYSIFSHGFIYSVYREYYQINDTKLDQFLKRFYELAAKFDVLNIYYNALLKLSLLNRDKLLAAKAAEGFQNSQIQGCFICDNKPMLGYYLLIDEPKSAEALIEKIITKNFSKENQMRFPDCGYANAASLYDVLLGYSLETHKPEYFKRYFPDYLSSVNYKIPSDNGTMCYYYRAIIGDFSKISKDKEQIKKDLVSMNEKTATTFSSICDFLCWYLYFSLYAEIFSDTITLDFEIPSLSPLDEKGTYSAAELSKAFEKLADGFGEKLDQSRKHFSYSALKHSFEEVKTTALPEAF